MKNLNKSQQSKQNKWEKKRAQEKTKINSKNQKIVNLNAPRYDDVSNNNSAVLSTVSSVNWNGANLQLTAILLFMLIQNVMGDIAKISNSQKLSARKKEDQDNNFAAKSTTVIPKSSTEGLLTQQIYSVTGPNTFFSTGIPSHQKESQKVNQKKIEEKPTAQQVYEMDVQKLINTVPIEVKGNLTKSQIKYETDLVKKALKQLDPKILQIVLNSKNFKISLDTLNNGRVAEYNGGNEIVWHYGFPPYNETHPLFERCFISKFPHEVRHAASAIITSNGDPLSYVLESKTLPTVRGFESTPIEKARLKPNDAVSYVYDPAKKEWFLLVQDLDYVPSIIKLSNLSKMELEKEQEKLDMSSVVTIDLSEISKFLEKKTIKDLSKDAMNKIVNAMTITHFQNSISIIKDISIEKQIREFNKNAFELMEQMISGLSDTQEDLIEQYYKPIPEIAPAKPVTEEQEKSFKNSFEEAKKLGVFLVNKSATIRDFYKGSDGKLYILSFEGTQQKQDKLTAFQEWFKKRKEEFLQYKKPSKIADEISAFLGEMPPELAKGLFPELWERCNKPIQEYWQSMTQEQQNSNTMPYKR
jgi:hypothetical protein